MYKESFYKSSDFFFNHRYLESPGDFPLHIHDIYELIYLKTGDVSYMEEGKLFKPGKNCLLLTKPFKNHIITFNSPVRYERYNILFDEKKLSSNILNELSPDIMMLNFESNTLVSDIFKKMDYYCENFEGDKLKYILLHLTEEVLFNCVLTSKKSNQSAIYTTNPVIQGILEYIDRNINTPLTVDAICNELFISRSHLHHLFIQHLKFTPQKYILAKKMATAQRELRSGSKATKVYTACGFVDYSTFFRAYKKYFGHAPSDEINTEIVRKIQS